MISYETFEESYLPLFVIYFWYLGLKSIGDLYVELFAIMNCPRLSNLCILLQIPVSLLSYGQVKSL